MKRIVFLAITLSFTACARPGDHPISTNCVWTEEDNRSLNLENAADRRHLRYDAITAEDMAIRWADQYYGHTPEWDGRQNECMEALLRGVAGNHRVELALARQYRLNRDIILDSIVFLGFGALYAAAAYYSAGRIRRRFPPGEDGYWIMTPIMAAGFSIVGVLVGNVGAITIETLRLNSIHLSYRMDRIPWRQHSPEVLVCCLVIFGLAAVIRSRAGMRVNGKA